MKTSLEEAQERLSNLKEYRLNEQRSSKPSHNYIEDLDLSIERLEKRISNGTFVDNSYKIIR